MTVAPSPAATCPSPVEVSLDTTTTLGSGIEVAVDFLIPAFHGSPPARHTVRQQQLVGFPALLVMLSSMNSMTILNVMQLYDSLKLFCVELFPLPSAVNPSRLLGQQSQ